MNLQVCSGCCAAHGTALGSHSTPQSHFSLVVENPFIFFQKKIFKNQLGEGSNFSWLTAHLDDRNLFQSNPKMGVALLFLNLFEKNIYRKIVHLEIETQKEQNESEKY